MRMYLYIFVATLFVFSCAKEKENLVVKNESISDPQTDVTAVSIFPDMFTAGEENVKTDYDADGVFFWVLNDEAAVYAVDNVTTPENQGWIAYQATTLTNENKNATFTKIAGQDAKEADMTSYTKTGIAIYPSSVASPSSGNTGATAYGAAFITLPSSVAGTSSENVLIGTADDAENPTSFSFRSAMAQMRVTVTGIPAQAASLRLYTNDQENFPLAGNFVLTASKEITHEDYRKVGESHSGLNYLSIALPGTEIASQDYFFSIPTGEYPANTLTLKMLDGDDNVLLEKTLTKAINFKRNDLVRMSSLANQWVTLGIGKFIDNFLWAKIVAKGLNKDIPGYVNVTIQKNVVNPNRFRLINPYGMASTQFGYISPNDANRDMYLEFTVDGYSAGASVTGFTTHRTGFAIDASNYNPELVYPTEYDAGYTTVYNKVVAGNPSNPQIVQFAPVYRYNGSSTAYNYTTHKMDKHGVFRIIFPGVSNFGGSLTVPNGTNARLQNLKVTKETGGPARIKMSASTYTDYDIAAPNVNDYSVSTNMYPGIISGANGSCDWNNTGLHNSHTVPSGAIYLTWFTVDANTPSYVYDQGRLKVYYLNDEAPIGTYSNGTLSVTFDVSPNSAIGNIVISSITNSSTTYDATYDVFGIMSHSSSQWDMSFESGQLYANYDTGLNHPTYGMMDKLSFQGLNGNWVDPCTAYIKDTDEKLYALPYFVLRPTNDAARASGGKLEGHASYADYKFDLYYGLGKQ